MNFEEIVDFALYALYDGSRAKGQWCAFKEVFQANEETLSDADLKMLVDVLKEKGFAQGFRKATLIGDTQAQIMPAGTKFVESDSFSNPGTSIKSMMEGQ